MFSILNDMATMTSQQLRDYEARMFGKTMSRPITNDSVEDESDLHNAIIDYCKSKGWQYLHGSMAHKTFRTLGECDFQILANGGRFFLVECKSASGKLSLDQQGFIAHAARNGHTVHVIRSMDEFRNLVDCKR
jgi:hypothetical protein